MNAREELIRELFNKLDTERGTHSGLCTSR